MFDELVYHELGRKDADQRHVVFDSDRQPSAEFIDQGLDRGGLKEATLSNLCRLERRLDIIATSAVGEEAFSLRSAVRLLVSLLDRMRYEMFRTALQNIFLIQYLHFEIGWDRCCQLDYPVIQEREASLDRMRHCHPVSLR